MTSPPTAHPSGPASLRSPAIAAPVPPVPPVPLPGLYTEGSNGSGRAIAFSAVVLAHIAAGWGLMQLDSVREAVIESAPIFVNLIAPPPPAPPPPIPKPLPPKPPPKVIPKPRPVPIVTAPPSPAPAPFVAPPPPTEPPPPPSVVEAPPAPPAPPAPVPPAPPAEPKTIPATAVRYREPPSPVYPATSRRMRETGRVVVRALVDKGGTPRTVLVLSSSNFSRLDDAALAAVRASRFQPYTENGMSFDVWVQIPIEFNLEDR